MGVKKQDKSKIIQIWGDILDEGFTSVPNILLRYRSNLKIRSHHLALIVDIMSFKWDSENPFPSYSALAERAGMTERGIMKTVQDLERLNLLIRTPRFDGDSGVQITTIFDFEPLVQKLTEELQKAKMRLKTTVIEGAKTRSGEGELDITRRVNYSSGRGVNYSSPKEYSYNNKTQIKKNKKTLEVQNSEKKKIPFPPENIDHTSQKERVQEYFRDGIFRTRLFEIYDNLHGMKTIEELVEEGAYKACKEVMFNRAGYLSKSRLKINPDHLAKDIRHEFPYHKVPEDYEKSRSFFVASICNLTSKKISSLFK